MHSQGDIFDDWAYMQFYDQLQISLEELLLYYQHLGLHCINIVQNWHQ